MFLLCFDRILNQGRIIWTDIIFFSSRPWHLANKPQNHKWQGAQMGLLSASDWPFGLCCPVMGGQFGTTTPFRFE